MLAFACSSGTTSPADRSAAKLCKKGACRGQRPVIARRDALRGRRRAQASGLVGQRRGSMQAESATERSEVGRLLCQQAVEVDEDDVRGAVVERVAIRGGPVAQPEVRRGLAVDRTAVEPT